MKSLKHADIWQTQKLLLCSWRFATLSKDAIVFISNSSERRLPLCCSGVLYQIVLNPSIHYVMIPDNLFITWQWREMPARTIVLNSWWKSVGRSSAAWNFFLATGLAQGRSEQPGSGSEGEIRCWVESAESRLKNREWLAGKEKAASVKLRVIKCRHSVSQLGSCQLRVRGSQLLLILKLFSWSLLKVSLGAFVWAAQSEIVWSWITETTEITHT